jgi:hypothetical protein
VSAFHRLAMLTPSVVRHSRKMNTNTRSDTGTAKVNVEGGEAAFGGGDMSSFMIETDR